MTPPIVTEKPDGPLTLTTKNLDMYNTMVLNTLRTSKFDER